VREGSDVRIDAGLFRTDDGQAIARASVTGDPREIASITDSIAAILLRSAWRTPTAEVPGVSSVTTRSLPALQAFLEGEHALLEGRWQGAAQSYQRAMKADSTFWLAYWRFEYARAWYLNLDDSDIIDAIKAHRTALPERDRLVFESWLTDTIALALSRAREATERFADYWPGWMQYGDWLFHSGPVYGDPEGEAQAALERTVALNPAFIPAWEHLLWVALVRDTTAAARALAGKEGSGVDARAGPFETPLRQRARIALSRLRRVRPRLARLLGRFSGARGRAEVTPDAAHEAMHRGRQALRSLRALRAELRRLRRVTVTFAR